MSLFDLSEMPLPYPEGQGFKDSLQWQRNSPSAPRDARGIHPNKQLTTCRRLRAVPAGSNSMSNQCIRLRANRCQEAIKLVFQGWAGTKHLSFASLKPSHVWPFWRCFQLQAKHVECKLRAAACEACPWAMEAIHKHHSFCGASPTTEQTHDCRKPILRSSSWSRLHVLISLKEYLGFRLSPCLWCVRPRGSITSTSLQQALRLRLNRVKL